MVVASREEKKRSLEDRSRKAGCGRRIHTAGGISSFVCKEQLNDVPNLLSAYWHRWGMRWTGRVLGLGRVTGKTLIGGVRGAGGRSDRTPGKGVRGHRS